MTAFDLNTDAVRTLNQHLHDSPSGNTSVTNPGGRHCIACGIDAAIDIVLKNVQKLRDMSPLWDMAQEGIDISSIEWEAH